MEQEALKTHMKYYLSAFNDEQVDINDETIHETVLSSSDGVKGIANSKSQYQNFVRWSIIRAGKKEGKKPKEVDKPWPTDWMKQSVSQLAQSLLAILIFLFLSLPAKSQVDVNLSAVKTDLKDNAIKIGIRYLQQWDSLFKIQDVFAARNKSLLQLAPSFDIQTGTEDAFSSITAKLSGMWMHFKTKELAGNEAVDVGRTWHIIPISIGFESNNRFDVVNGIFEVGWIPWYQSYARHSPDWIRNTSLAFYLQAGYKFSKDTSGKVGGEVDESLEAEESGIVRLKGSATANIFNPVTIGSFRLGLVGGADVYYDVLNSAIYHKLDADLRFFVSADDFISLKYSHGSGAPLFNQADEWGIGLRVSF